VDRISSDEHRIAEGNWNGENHGEARRAVAIMANDASRDCAILRLRFVCRPLLILGV
jgi:hypothetical protein